MLKKDYCNWAYDPENNGQKSNTFNFSDFKGMYLEKEVNKVSLGYTEFSCQDKLRKCVFIFLARSLYSACVTENIYIQ